tara:strand:+ start:7888 stop:8901 length:1014 start_codon:yes stop_codon:yes gene_type:complete
MAYQIGYEIEAYGLNAQQIREVIESKGAEFLTPGSRRDSNFDFPEDRLFGYSESKRIPLRCTKSNPNYENNKAWIAATDGSLTARGLGPAFEIISPVLHGAAGMKEAARIHKALVKAGAVTHRTAGNHIHMGINHSARWARMSDRKKAEVGKRLAHVYSHFQPVIDALLSNVRCSGVAGRTGSGYGPSTRPVNTARPFLGRCVLNLGSWVLQGRVEFRQVGNTLRWDVIEGMTSVFKAMLNVCFNENHPNWTRRMDDFHHGLNITPVTLDGMVEYINLGSKTTAFCEGRIIELRNRFQGNRDMRNTVLQVNLDSHSVMTVGFENLQEASVRRFGEVA